jgi:RNA polymerase sigma factor (sigma-70 family)
VPTREEAFEALLTDYSRLIASAIRRVCARRWQSLVPDVEQEVYAALWKRLGGGKDIDHPASYVYKVALTTALAVVRKHGPETAPIEAVNGGPLPDAGRGTSGLLPAERARLLGEALERLAPDEERAVRAHLAGFSHVEVARLYGWTESVARHRIYRAIDALKEEMKGRSLDDRARTGT